MSQVNYYLFFKELKKQFIVSEETSFCSLSIEFRKLWMTYERATIIHLAWLFLESDDSKIWHNVGTRPNFKVGLSRLFFDAWATAEQERAFRLEFLDFCIKYYSEL